MEKCRSCAHRATCGRADRVSTTSSTQCRRVGIHGLGRLHHGRYQCDLRAARAGDAAHRQLARRCRPMEIPASRTVPSSNTRRCRIDGCWSTRRSCLRQANGMGVQSNSRTVTHAPSCSSDCTAALSMHADRCECRSRNHEGESSVGWKLELNDRLPPHRRRLRNAHHLPAASSKCKDVPRREALQQTLHNGVGGGMEGHHRSEICAHTHAHTREWMWP